MSSPHSVDPSAGGQPQGCHRTPDDLARRAIAAARANASRLAHQPGRRVDSAWRERAARATRILAATLGLDPAVVAATPDDQRLYGRLGIPEVLLTVTVAAGIGSGTEDVGQAATQPAQYSFIPELGRDDAFLQLLPCPRCSHPVPTRRILTLIDLGRSLDPEVAHRRMADTEQFPEDPAHESTCPLHLRVR